MDKLVEFIAPRTKLDFVFKLALIILLIGVLNHLRGFLLTPDTATTFFEDLINGAFVGLPFASFSLYSFLHMLKLQRNYSKLALTDVLTKMPNRRAFMEELNKITESDVQESSENVLLLIDIDKFKHVNDQYGHDVGDECLQKAAEHLESIVRRSDFIGRVGGEEFAILMPGCSLKTAQRIAEIITDGFEFQIGASAQSIKVTYSAGATDITPTDTQKTVLKKADDAMYRAKNSGRATVKLHVNDDSNAPRSARDVPAQQVH